MVKRALTQPTFIMLYGFPGVGKTYFARQLCEDIQAAHVQDDRIRHELFEAPRYDRDENRIVHHLMDYMSEEFLRAGISVVYDTNVVRGAQRRVLRDMARKHKAHSILVWMQIDIESAYARIARRDRRKTDDKFAEPMDRTTFDIRVQYMQNPGVTEEYVVISGKHNFGTQKNIIMKKFYEHGLLSAETTSSRVVKPQLVNLVPNSNGGRVDPTRRNIAIR